MSKIRGTISASAEVYISDLMDEVDTEDLISELKDRGKWQEVQKELSNAERDWDLLAELIAEGSTQDALDLLASMSPVKINPHLVRTIVTNRCGRRA